MAQSLALRPGLPRPAAVLALGGFLPEPEKYLELKPPFPPIALVAGLEDEVVPVERARRTRELLEKAGAQVLYRETPAGHWIDQDVVPDLHDFLGSVLA